MRLLNSLKPTSPSPSIYLSIERPLGVTCHDVLEYDPNYLNTNDS